MSQEQRSLLGGDDRALVSYDGATTQPGLTRDTVLSATLTGKLSMADGEEDMDVEKEAGASAAAAGPRFVVKKW